MGIMVHGGFIRGWVQRRSLQGPFSVPWFRVVVVEGVWFWGL